jgi:hypothetical protein
MAGSDLPFPNNARADNSLFGGARFGRKKRTIFLLLLVAAFFVLWFNSDLDRSSSVYDDATGVSTERQKEADNIPTTGAPLSNGPDEEEEQQQQQEEEVELEEETVKMPTETKPQTIEKPKKPANSVTTIHMQPQHFKYFIVIGSRTSSQSRRQLIRDTYFGLKDNIEPCMKRDKGVNYMFYVYGDEPEAKTPERRLYETEKMEWNDLEKVDAKSFKQDDVLKWVNILLFLSFLGLLNLKIHFLGRYYFEQKRRHF